MKLRHLAAASFAALGAPAVSLAQTDQAPPPDIAGATAANAVATVVVTANRTPTPIDQVGQSITVLTGADIRLDQEIAVADILARTPGLSVTRDGGPGETTSVFIRGADADHTVVLIDGVKVNDVSSPGISFDFSRLLAGDIARIEVLRGPQSTLYGSEAIGGVVNVVTADATKPLQGDVQIEGGSYGTGYANGAIGGKGDRFDWRLGTYYFSTDGVSAFDKAFGGREDDGFHTAGVQGRFRYDFTADLQFDERVYYTYGRNEFDGDDTPTGAFGDDLEFGRTQQVVDYTGLNIALLGGRLKNRLALEYNEDINRDEDPSELYVRSYESGNKATFDALGRTTSFDYEGTYALAPGYTLVFGAEDDRSTLNTDAPAFYETTPTKANRSTDAGYGQITGRVLPGLTLTGGVRYTSDSAFGGHTTGQASAAWVARPGTILRASYGGGFKAPSLYQLYSNYGNAGLQPETANGWDASVEQHVFDDRLVLQATYFGRDTDKLIEFVSTDIAPFGFYQNVDRSRAEGLELQGELKPVDHLDITANYTFDDDEDRSLGDVEFGKQLLNRPKNTANLAATYVWPVKLSTTLAVRYAGRSVDENFNAFPAAYLYLGSYALVDIRASYPLTDRLELYGRVENLANQAYETAYQYGTLGRAAYGGVRVTF